ncbi:MAG TPA: alanyl-tRNA editing protein [Candidatus Bathyarchaeia archaeon]|nr:alanyl-tRNA editing protein [Candidatus Bathyarchaeia archaeon]
MTRKLYWEEPYSREFRAKVVAVDGAKIELDQTLFYPRGGGVSSDIGTLGGRKVTETTKDGDRIFHNTDSAEGIETGHSIEGSIDWDRRHRLMRMHTAGHLLSALFYKSNCLITGNQIDVDRSRMDFNLEVFDRSQIENHVNEANRLISKDAQVKSYFLEREEALKVPELVKLAEAAPPAEAKLRIVEITGIDKQADGGLHVAHLNEIGRINLLKLENKGKTNRRMYYDVTSA